MAQILGYLRSSGVEHGLPINFGAPKFEIKKYALSRKGGSTIVSSPGAEKVNQTMVEPLSRVPARVRGH